jgi:cytochrome c oxidase assembly protein subunit 15
MSFERFAKLTLVSIFLIIVAGAVVRMTGSGMGCPDWPKCFGLVVPPTSIDQIEWDSGKNFSKGQMIIFEEQLWSAKNDFISSDVYNQNNWTLYTKHDYASFNPAHTWTEYVNRLIGAVSGLFTFIMLLMSFRYWEAKRKIVYLSALVVFLMGFQGWLGARVVYSVLQPAQITIHMLMALVIVTFMVYLISEIPKSNKKPSYVNDKGLKRILMVAIVLSFIQIALGTQVRQLIDEISSSFDYGQRELWLGLVGSTFVIHRSFAIVLMLVNALLFWRNYKLSLGFKLVNAVFTVVLIEIISGVTLAYFDMMAIMQPVHMVVATVLFVLQIALYFQLKKSLIQQ